MKKFIIALIVTLVFTAPSFAASSDDIYVRKDVFDVHMLNINQNLEKISNRLDKIELSISELSKAIAVLSERTDRNFDTLSARIDGLNSSLSARIEGTNSRIDDLRNGMYLWLVIIGTFITLVSVVIAWPKAKNFIQSRASQKQSFTLDDVEKLIDARINSKFHS